MSSVLAAHTKKLVGTDISEAMVDQYNRKAEGLGLSKDRMVAIVADLQRDDSKLEGQKFDFVVVRLSNPKSIGESIPITYRFAVHASVPSLSIHLRHYEHPGSSLEARLGQACRSRHGLLGGNCVSTSWAWSWRQRRCAHERGRASCRRLQRSHHYGNVEESWFGERSVERDRKGAVPWENHRVVHCRGNSPSSTLIFLLTPTIRCTKRSAIVHLSSSTVAF